MATGKHSRVRKRCTSPPRCAARPGRSCSQIQAWREPDSQGLTRSSMTRCQSHTRLTSTGRAPHSSTRQPPAGSPDRSVTTGPVQRKVKGTAGMSQLRPSSHAWRRPSKHRGKASTDPQPSSRCRQDSNQVATHQESKARVLNSSRDSPSWRSQGTSAAPGDRRQDAGLRRGARTDMDGAGFQRGKPAPPAVSSMKPMKAPWIRRA